MFFFFEKILVSLKRPTLGILAAGLGVVICRGIQIHYHLHFPMTPKFIALNLSQVLLAPILDLLWMSANPISKF